MTSSLIDHLDSLADVASRCPTSPILAEQHWRRVSAQRADAYGKPDVVIVARWTHASNAPLELANEGNVADHCTGLNLKCAALTFDHAGRRPVRGRLTAGAVR